MSNSGCAQIRAGHHLIYAAHSGFGNQELSLRRALLVAYVSNRTLVLPPVLQQADLSFGPPEKRCRDSTWQAELQKRAEGIYVAKALNDHAYESLRGCFDFGELERLGMRVADYRELPNDARSSLVHAPLAKLGCEKSDRYTAQKLRQALRVHDAAPSLRIGSTYFLKADLEGLVAADACFRALTDAVLRMPPTRAVRSAADALTRRMRGAPYAAVHLRLADGGVSAHEASEPTPDAEIRAATEARQLLRREVRWLMERLARRLPAPVSGESARRVLYVASNVPGGVRSELLAPLCAGATAYNCTDLAALDAGMLPEYRALLRERGGGLAAGTAALLLDQAMGARATLGFFATSKFCGPPGFRRSTFSEGIALRWHLRNAAGRPPLCAHAMPRALLQGRTAHGTRVY